MLSDIGSQLCFLILSDLTEFLTLYEAVDATNKPICVYFEPSTCFILFTCRKGIDYKHGCRYESICLSIWPIVLPLEAIGEGQVYIWTTIIPMLVVTIVFQIKHCMHVHNN